MDLALCQLTPPSNPKSPSCQNQPARDPPNMRAGNGHLCVPTRKSCSRCENTHSVCSCGPATSNWRWPQRMFELMMLRPGPSRRANAAAAATCAAAGGTGGAGGGCFGQSHVSSSTHSPASRSRRRRLAHTLWRARRRGSLTGGTPPSLSLYILLLFH